VSYIGTFLPCLTRTRKGRAELAASKTNPLARLLPARLLPPDESTVSSAATAAHHSSVTWYLNRRLAEASEAQKEMQEERIKRQLERTKTLGSGAAREALAMAIPGSSNDIASSTTSSIGGSWLGGAASSFAASIRGTDSPLQPSYPVPSESDLGSEDDEELELSQSQILQFESENASILQDVQDTLASVQQAEARILEISALQTELLTHLQTQTQITEQLYEDAIAATGQVEKGNVQLREAKRRAKDSRLFILVFLIGASLSLLFLHYY
jgi:syntaxin 18